MAPKETVFIGHRRKPYSDSIRFLNTFCKYDKCLTATVKPTSMSRMLPHMDTSAQKYQNIWTHLLKVLPFMDTSTFKCYHIWTHLPKYVSYMDTST